MQDRCGREPRCGYGPFLRGAAREAALTDPLARNNAFKGALSGAALDRTAAPCRRFCVPFIDEPTFYLFPFKENHLPNVVPSFFHILFYRMQIFVTTNNFFTLFICQIKIRIG